MDFFSHTGWCYWYYAYFAIFLALIAYSNGEVQGCWNVSRMIVRQYSEYVISPAVLLIVTATIEVMSPGRSGTDMDLGKFNLSLDSEALKYLNLSVTPTFEPMGWGNLYSTGYALRKCKGTGCDGMLVIRWVPPNCGRRKLNPLYLYLVQVLPYFERLWFPYRAAICIYCPGPSVDRGVNPI